MELFVFNGSAPCWRVHLALEAKGIPYELRALKGSEGEHKKPEYLAINPRGKAPALRDGDVMLGESLAIMAYLDAKDDRVPLFGKSAAETGAIWQTLMDLEDNLHRPVVNYIRPIYFGRLDTELGQVEAAAAAMKPELARLNEHFTNNTWLVGSDMSAADLSLQPHLESILRATFNDAAPDLGLRTFAQDYPALHGFMERMRALPYYDKTFPPHWK
jgi:glutathione S-transferase